MAKANPESERDRWRLFGFPRVRRPSSVLSEMVQRAAKRARKNPWIVASALAAYRRRHHLSEAQLGVWLGASAPSVATLALCRRPDPASPVFLEEVEDLADTCGCDAARLAELLSENQGRAR